MSDNPFLESSGMSKSQVFTEYLQTIVIALAISLILYLVFLVPSIVDGISMQPNFQDKQLLFANKTTQWLGNTSIGERLGLDYKRGDVVIFSNPPDNLIKRIIAVEGDLIRFSGGDVYINGKKLVEEYLPSDRKTVLPPSQVEATVQEDQTVRVPDGRYFVMGDNRPNSRDSRYADVGFVTRAQLRGKVFLRYWPVTEFKFIGTGSYTEETVSGLDLDAE